MFNRDKMNKTLLIFAVLFVIQSRAGYIQTTDLLTDFNNINYVRQLEFSFKLENALTKDAGFVIHSPIDLGSTNIVSEYKMHNPTKCSDSIWISATIM
jgi:hypothetical protein